MFKFNYELKKRKKLESTELSEDLTEDVNKVLTFIDKTLSLALNSTASRAEANFHPGM